MGYAGGTTPDPTYRRIGDHTECIQVDYDPDEVSYADLLGEFLAMHDPTRPAHSAQYASLVLYEDDAQRDAALAALEAAAVRHGRPTLTRVEPLRSFHVAEDYHQKYALRSDDVLCAGVRGRLGDDDAFRDSTVAARLNGFAYGLGGLAMLYREIDSFGLPAVAASHLRARVLRAG